MLPEGAQMAPSKLLKVIKCSCGSSDMECGPNIFTFCKAKLHCRGLFFCKAGNNLSHYEYPNNYYDSEKDSA